MDVEEFLSESRKLWRSLVENTRDLICITDLSGVIRYATPSHLDMLGYQPLELVGESFFCLVHPDDLETALSTFAEGMGERKVMYTHGRYRHRDGHALWMEATGMPLVEEGGRLIGGIVVSRDVTERVESERFLRIQRDLALRLAQAASLEETLSLSLEAVLEATGFDGGGVYLVNEETGSLDLACYQGLSEEFVAAISHYGAGSPNTRLVMAGEPIYRKHEEIVSVRSEVLQKEGLMATAVVPVRHQGEVIGDVNIASRTFTEVSEKERNAVETMAGQIGQAIARVRLDSALRESEARYRAVFEATGTAMCVVDAAGRIVFTNHEFLYLSGYRLESMREGLRLRDLLAGSGGEEALRCLRSLEEGESGVHRHLSLRLSCADGGSKEVLASMGLLPGRDAAVLSLIDVTREWEYERELEEKARQLADFLGIASHELRHPITLIRGYAETMLEALNEGRSKTVDEVMVAIEASTYRLMHLVEELLDVSRIEEARFPVQRVPALLEPLVLEAAAEMRERYANREFAVEAGEEAPPLPLDPERVRQLMVILLENAAHFSPPGPAVEVEIARAGGDALVSVKDRGMGVPAGEEERIFERFYQVEDFNHHSTPGLGMGLFIAASIVEAHGGRIWHEARPDGGSVFRFTLPLQG